MRLSKSVSVFPFVFVACSTALPSSAFEPSSGTNSSTAGEDSTKNITTFNQTPSATDHEPCLLASRAVASFSASSPSATLTTIPAKVAYDCLKSVPIVKGDALRLVTDLAPYFEIQTTINILKDPPSGYLFPGVDLMTGLARIESHVRDGGYTSEYDFEFDLYTLVQSAHDGFFNYLPDIFSGVFQFIRKHGLVSLSKDGLELPKLYFQVDLDLQRKNGSFTPSPVVSIDGTNAVDFLQDWSFGVTSLQDPDAAYNSLFLSFAPWSDYLPAFILSDLYPGATTEFSFENGTTVSYPNEAIVAIDLEGIQSGGDLYTKVLGAKPSPTPPSGSSSFTASATPLPTGYPFPVVKHPTNAVNGFFLEDSINNDVAVLSVSSFDDDTQEFLNVLQGFLAKAKTFKKTKLIIDLQFSGTGVPDRAVELFKQLFPSLSAYTVGNIRANAANDVLGQIISGFNTSSKTYSGHYSYGSTDFLSLLIPYDFQRDNLPDGSATYGSWSEVFGPVATSHDNFTEVFQSYGSAPDSITGGSTQPFAVKDTVILSDGFCTGTCGMFSEYMKTQVGVQTIVVGGRPQYGPMQGVGGAKGEKGVAFAVFAAELAIVESRTTPALQKKLNDTKLGQLSTYPHSRSPFATFNYENRIRRGDVSATPLQFVYEAADCRIFYTSEMHTNISTMWNRVANMAFGNSSSPRQDWSRNPYCVRDSTGHRSSISIGGPNNTDYAGSAPPAVAKSRAQLPLMPDGQRMGWRLNLTTAANNGVVV